MDDPTPTPPSGWSGAPAQPPRSTFSTPTQPPRSTIVPPSRPSAPVPPQRPSSVPTAPPAAATPTAGATDPTLTLPAAAAPVRPPSATRLDGPPTLGDQYRPAAPPPGSTGPATPTPSPASGQGRWGWRAAVAFLAGGLVAAGGFGAARLTEGDTVIAAETPEGTTTVSVVETEDGPSIVLEDGANVAAFVAQTLGPSVVQVNTELGTGSGVVFGEDLVMTNNHVIEGASTIAVQTSDGRALPATLVGTDPDVDIAVLRLTDSGLPVAELAPEGSVEVGETAIAIGSPFDLQQTVTQGIVSAVNRPMATGTSITAMIQTDAPINPGNSGGALADSEGRVIGINTAIRTDGTSATNAGIGFAVPIDTALNTAEAILSGDPLTPAFLGVRGEPSANGDAGVVVTEVTAGSGAAEAGLLVGDRILTFDGAPVTEITELAGLVRSNRPGDVVTFEVVRNGQTLMLEATLGAVPEDAGN